MPPATTTTVHLDLHYVAPPEAHTPEQYRAYIDRQLEANHGVLTNPALAATGGFHVRNTGRSTLIGLSLLAQAQAAPGQLIKYRDHFHGEGQRAQYHMRDVVLTICQSHPDYQHLLPAITAQGVRVPVAAP